MYADGSKVGEKVGVGVWRMGPGGGTMVWGAGLTIRDKMEIMDKEMVGINKALENGIGECISP